MKFQSLLIATAISAVLATGSASAMRLDDPAVEANARHLISANAGKVFTAADDQFALRNMTVDADGTEHVRFTRTYKSLPVIGGDFVVHSQKGRLLSVSQTMNSKMRPSMATNISDEDAIIAAGTAFGTGFKGMPSARQVVYARNMAPRLAFEVVMMGEKRDQTPTEMHYFVDAKSGAILDQWDMVHTAKPGSGGGGGTAAVGTGRTLLYGDVVLNTASASGTFNLTDTTRGGGATYDALNRTYSTAARGATLFTDADNTWGNNATSDRATVAADAHYGVATTWDYYKNNHGRNGIFNDGKGVKSYVHVGNGWINAAWYANAMYYGDGGSGYAPLVSLDVAGHEMSHGVNQAEANLAYSNDSGGLNEANSDIMGTMVEFYANNPSDPGDYKIGEELSSSPLRYMYDPNLDGNASYDCYPAGGLGGVDPHYSSGPANHFFYLLAEGTTSLTKTCAAGDSKNATGSGSLSGIGRTAAAAIWYRAIRDYMTSSTTYPGARSATLQAATAIYGAGSSQYNAVAAAWSAINVN
ncbi:MAG: M4 family metallopeptidase [Xanthomonadales bacterium]|nr:M4 family metallopeptidase [Xanthomonadales bacterium]MBP6078498.1 M4 family metallopeptidase [Xanthomonadales bacterium]